MTLPARILVLGAQGMLGSACMRAFWPDVIGRDLDDFDLTDREETLKAIAELTPQVIVNCAAATDVDLCETDRDYADRGNVIAPKHAAEAAASVGAKMLHISTDFVFDGQKGGPYNEDDEPRPLSYYGASKLAGEKEVLLAAPDALVVRTSWLYGHEGDHFPGRVLGWAEGGGPLRVVDDQVGSPTYVDDLAAALKALVETDASGLFHLGGSGCASRFDWAHETLALAGLDIEVLPACSDEFPLPAERPADSCLDCSKAASLGVELPAWQEGLARFIGLDPGYRASDQVRSAEVLILGAKGMLGSACMRAFGRGAVGRDRDDLDLSDPVNTQREVALLRPRLIINCAAAADVDLCEMDREYAYQGNVTIARSVAEAAAGVGAKLVHMSTVFVFDGKQHEPYRETDQPHPINYYGQSKLEGERAVIEALPDALIVRTSWMYGVKGHHFPSRLTKWVTHGEPLRIAADQTGSPTYADDLAVALKTLVETDASGIVHLGGFGCASRIDYAHTILDLLRIDTEIVPASSEDFPLPAKRPMNSCLDCAKAISLGVELPPWRDSLARYIRSDQNG